MLLKPRESEWLSSVTAICNGWEMGSITPLDNGSYNLKVVKQLHRRN